MTDHDWPITGVVIVTDPKQCPTGYIIINKTYDRREEADLWRDGLFGRRVTRFMCVERSAPSSGKNILVDISLINEKDDVPAGFTCIELTEDTKEKAMKKKTMCVRWMSASITNDAITELVIMSRGVKRAPNGYSLVGDVNNMALCYKMTSIRSPSHVVMPSSYTNNPTSYTSGTANPQAFNMSQFGGNLPYTIHQRQDMLTRTGPPKQSASSLAMMTVNPLSGLGWNLDPKYQNANKLKNTLPEIRYKTMMDIEQQYDYKFILERNALD